MTKIHINEENVDKIKPYHYFVDASDLRLPPGEFPDSFSTDFGNGLDLQKSYATEDGMVYFQGGSDVTLMVYND